MTGFKALVFPSGSYHFCLNDLHLVVAGHETMLHIKYLSKKAWEEQELYETCYYAKQYFEANMNACPISSLTDRTFYARYQNYGCYIASNINTPLLQSFETHLGEQNDFSKTSLITYDGNTQVWPPNTFHYCYDNNHLTVEGNDMILTKASGNSMGKRGWSNYEREDSCHHIRQYFKEKSNSVCDVEELTPFPVRSYGGCFVSMNLNSTRRVITDELQRSISGKCTGCDNGLYYDPFEDRTSGAVRGKIGIPIMIIMLLVIILNGW